MRRWLLVFLMALLPLQLSWAAVAAYCQHEQTPAQAVHFGHHEHQHHDEGAIKAKDAHGDKKTSPTVGFSDFQCMYGADAFCKLYVVMELVCTHVFGSLDGQG